MTAPLVHRLSPDHYHLEGGTLAPDTAAAFEKRGAPLTCTVHVFRKDGVPVELRSWAGHVWPPMWSEYFEAHRDRRVGDYITITEAGAALFAAADAEHERERQTRAVERAEESHERRMSGVPNSHRTDQERP